MSDFTTYFWRNTPHDPDPEYDDDVLEAKYGPVDAEDDGPEGEHAKKGGRPNAYAWLKTTRMSQTEVALRLVYFLIARRVTAAPVSVALTAVSSSGIASPAPPSIPSWRGSGSRKTAETHDWRTTYSMGAAPATLVLHDRFGQGDVVATLTSGRRLIAEVNAGPIAPTRSCHEYRHLRSAVARAVTCPFAQPEDLVLAAGPRSTRFRDLAADFAKAPRFRATGVGIIPVDRAGTVSGCEKLDEPARYP